MPFFRSFVETLIGYSSISSRVEAPSGPLPSSVDLDHVLDPHTPEAGQVDAGLDRDHGPGGDHVLAVTAQGGPSWISRPTPCPSPWLKASP